jgi:hypothetical protein
MGKLPRWAQAVILLAVIVASASWLYYKYVIRSPQRVRTQIREESEANQAFLNTKELREKGSQKAGPSDYTVEATYVGGKGRNDYKDATIRKTDAAGKVVEEIKAPRMIVTNANEAEFFVAVFDATRTTYDEAGKPKVETIPGRKDMILYVFRVSGPR